MRKWVEVPQGCTVAVEVRPEAYDGLFLCGELADNRMNFGIIVHPNDVNSRFSERGLLQPVVS